MAIRGVTYNDDGAAGEKTPALFRADMDARYPQHAQVVFGDEADTYCEGNDSRLSDERVPVDNSVTNAKMGDGAVGVAELSASGTPSATTVLRGDNTWATVGSTIPDNTLTNAMMTDNAINTAEIADNAVTNAKLADNAVNTAEITDNAVTNAKMADDAVGIAELSATGTPSATTVLRGDNTWATVGSTIPDSTITNAMMADDAVGIAELSATGTPSDTKFLRGDNVWADGTVAVGDGAVSTNKIVDGAVTIPKIGATGTPGATNYLRGDGAWATLVPTPHDVYYMAFGANTTRAVGTGDNPMGIKLQRAAVFTSVTFRINTAGASGNLIVELRKNGSAVDGTSTTLAQSGTTSATSTGSWSFASGDLLTVYVTTADTTPGRGLVADITGTAA